MGVPEKWKKKNFEAYKYIDDTNGNEKMLLNNALTHFSTEKTKILIHAQQSEKLLNTVTNRPADLGMKVNHNKTPLLCISSALNSEVTSYVNTRPENHLDILLENFGFLLR